MEKASIQQALQTAQHTWLQPQQVYDLLSNYSNYGFKLSTTCPASPPASGLYLYDKKIVPQWAEDGGQWNLLKNGFIPISHGILIGYMWHEYGALLRRVYWLVSNESVVMVHYLSRSADTGVPKTPSPTPATAKQESSFSQLPSYMQMMQSMKGLDSSVPLSPTQMESALLSQEEQLKKYLLAKESQSRVRGGSPLGDLGFLPQLPSFASNPFQSILSGSAMGIPSMPMGMDFFPSIYSQNSSPAQQPQMGSMTSPLGRMGMNYLLSSTTPTPMTPMTPTSGTTSTPVNTPSPLSPEDSEEVETGRLSRRKKDPMDGGRPMDKMQKIRARKAEVARACRIRKKAYIKSLEEKTARLTARVAELEARLEQAESRNQVYREEQKALLERLATKGSTPSTDVVDVTSPAGFTYSKIEGESKTEEAKRLMEQMLAHARKPHLLIVKNLASIEENFEPVDHVKFLIWSCTQSEEFYSKFAWQSLVRKELALTDGQIQSFMDMKLSMSTLKKDTFDLQGKLKKLASEIKQHFSARERGVQELLTLLTPTQAAKLAVWVDQNSKVIEISRMPTPIVTSFLTPSISMGPLMLPTDDLLDTSEDDQMNLFPEVPHLSTPRNPKSVWTASPFAPHTTSPFTTNFSPFSSPVGEGIDREFFTA